MDDKLMAELEFLRKAYREKSALVKLSLAAYDILLTRYQELAEKHPEDMDGTEVIELVVR